MLGSGLVTSNESIVEFLNSCYSFGSLFVVAGENDTKCIVCEIKNVNDGLDQVSFVPIGDEDEILFQEGDYVNFVNEAGNINFSTKAIKIHNRSWMTVALPKELRSINQRSEIRSTLHESQITGKPKITSYAKEGTKSLMSFEGEVLDISVNGASFKIQASRLDGFYRDDNVELMITEKFPFLTRVKGKVFYKSIANMMNKEVRYYRLGIKFDKTLNLSSLFN